MKRIRYVPVVLLSSAILAACSERPTEPLAPMVPDPAESARPLLVQGADQDALARAVPGFGGMFYDAQGRPTVYLTDASQAVLARRALLQQARGNAVLPSEIVVLQGAHKYDDLKKWYDASWAEALDVPGAVYSDLDEAGNRLLFGVERGGSNELRKALKRMNVPDDMYTIQESEPIVQAATLRDKVTPIQGGLQIHFGNFLCTLGFNARFGTTSAFITNSHCTNQQGGVENTQYFQPLSSVDPTVIATEVADPAYFRKGQCPKGRRCRFSDSSRANYSSGVSFQLGRLAATSLGSVTITGFHTITNESDNSTSPVAVGQTVSKVGRTTGTSSGVVTNTCVNTNVSGSQLTQLCQTFVSAAVGSGDSGSPVFTGSGNVTLVGILWGGSSNGAQFVFSPLRSIKDELGAFSAH